MAANPKCFLLLFFVAIFLPGALSQSSGEVRVSITPPEVVRNYQEYVTFRCQVEGLRPRSQATWSRLASAIPADRHFVYPSRPSNISYLLLYNLRRSDSGIYRCTVNAAAGVSLQADAFLRVNGGPKKKFCQSNPCRNFGSCSEVPNSYRCSCSLPYTGRNCEQVDQCLLQPCQNSGLCRKSLNRQGFECSCLPGYTGGRCQYADACHSSPCRNNGFCQSSTEGGAPKFTCTCARGFLGQRCTISVVERTPLTPCSSSPCRNGATCLDVPVINSYVCVCPDGFQGGQCEINVARKPPTNQVTIPPPHKSPDYCSSSPCQNGATCVNTENGVSCRCARNFSGQLCAQYDNCSSNPCQHGGSCVNVGNTYQCNCSKEFMGTNCETYDWCHSSPCQNGGQCRNDAAMRSFACTCSGGYTGKTCGKRDYCERVHCYNGGACENLNTTFRCSCPDGFLGERCERTPQAGECAKYGKKMSNGELRDFFYTETLRTTKPAADIVFVVDESASMVTEHSWLTDVSNALDVSLKEHLIGVDVANQFGLVGFAKDSVMDMKGRIIAMENGRKFGRAEQFSKATKKLALNGRREDLYLGIALALDHYELRPGMACQIIGVTDEGRSRLSPSSRHSNKTNTPYEYDYIYEQLTAKGCVLNVVVNQQMKSGQMEALGIGSQRQGYVESKNGMFEVEPDKGEAVEISGHGSTHKDYTRLALATRGGAWDLNKLRKGGDVGMAFTKAFVHLKQREISRQLCERCTCDGGPTPSCREGCLGEPPSLVEISSYYDRLSTSAVNEGSSAMFTCDASGDPRPTCTWEYANGRALPSGAEYFGDGGCQVRLSGVSSTTCVRCIASNIEGSKQSTVQCVDYVAACEFSDGRKIFHGSSARNYSEVKHEELAQIPFISAVVVLVVDESGSMVGEHNWLNSTIPALEKNLLSRGVGTGSRENQYALVGFASPQTKLGHVIPLGIQDNDCGSADDVSAALSTLRRDGRREDGYAAIGILSSLSCVRNRRRNTTALQVILVTDEDRDQESLWQYETIRQEIVRHGGILNVVVQNQFHGRNEKMEEVRALGIDRRQRAVVPDFTRKGYILLPMGQPTKDTAHGSTEQDYVDLAMHTGGGAWDLGMLRDGTYREAFTLGFIAAKVEEIQVQILGRCHECLCSNGTLNCHLLSTVNTEQGCLNPVVNQNINVRVLGEATAGAESGGETRRAKVFTGDFGGFECVVTAPPEEGDVSISWRPHPIAAIQHHQKLEIASVTLEQTGEYVCEARNENGKNSGAVELTVVAGGPARPGSRQSSGLLQRVEERAPDAGAEGKQQCHYRACIQRKLKETRKHKGGSLLADINNDQLACCSSNGRLNEGKITGHRHVNDQKSDDHKQLNDGVIALSDFKEWLSGKRHVRFTCPNQDRKSGMRFYQRRGKFYFGHGSICDC